MQCKSTREWQIRAPWGDLSLTSWGNPLSPPVLLAHGRKDSSATFLPFLQLMDGKAFHFVSIDMPGSGNSVPLPNAAGGSFSDQREKILNDCLNIEVPEYPYNPESEKAILIVASQSYNQGPIASQSYNQGPSLEFRNEAGGPLELPRPGRSTLNPETRDYITIQMDKEESNIQSDSLEFTEDILFGVDCNDNLPNDIQPNAEKGPYTSGSERDTDWTDVKDYDSDFESQNHTQSWIDEAFDFDKFNARFKCNVKLGKKSEEFACAQITPRVREQYTDNTESFTNSVEHLNINEHAESLSYSIGHLNITEQDISPQKRKRGLKLRKIPEETIVCNDHGGRKCPFDSRPSFELPEEREFTSLGTSSKGVPNKVLHKMARGWSYRTKYDTKVSSYEYSIQNEETEKATKDSEPCVLPECPHMPPGLIEWIHTYFKNNKMQQQQQQDTYADDNGAGASANNDPLSPVVYLSRDPTYENFPLPNDLIAPSAPYYSPKCSTPPPFYPDYNESLNERNHEPAPHYRKTTRRSSSRAGNDKHRTPDLHQSACSPFFVPSAFFLSSNFQPSCNQSYITHGCCSDLPFTLAYQNLCSGELIPSLRSCGDMCAHQKWHGIEYFYRTVKGVKITRFHFVAAIDATIEHLGWDKFIFIGHSMGSELGLFYNIVKPGKITKMVLFDPEPNFRRLQVRDLSLYQEKFYDSYYNNYQKENFYLKPYTIQGAKEALMRTRNLPEDKASILLRKSLKHVKDDIYCFTWDGRLRHPAPHNYPNTYYIALFSNIPPTLIISATNSLEEKSQSGSLELLEMMLTLKNCFHVIVEGGHDVHLTHPERVVPSIKEFLGKEDKIHSKL